MLHLIELKCHNSSSLDSNIACGCACMLWMVVYALKALSCIHHVAIIISIYFNGALWICTSSVIINLIIIFKNLISNYFLNNSWNRGRRGSRVCFMYSTTPPLRGKCISVQYYFTGTRLSFQQQNSTTLDTVCDGEECSFCYMRNFIQLLAKNFRVCVRPCYAYRSCPLNSETG